MYFASSPKEFFFLFFKKKENFRVFTAGFCFNTYSCYVNMIFLGVLFMRHEQAVKMLFTNKQTKRIQQQQQQPTQNDKNR